MKIVRENGREWSDDELRDALRDVYAPPAGESYWNTLEQRILAVVTSDRPREWWSWFPGWVRIGMSAAAAAALVAGVAAWHTRVAQERLAYEQLIDTPQELPILTEQLGPETSRSARDATLRYLITHD